MASATDYDEFGNQIGTVTAALGQSIEYRGYDYIYDPETEDFIEVLATKTLYPHLGRAGALANGWAAIDNLDPTTVRPMYAMSELITVTAVPEPATCMMALAGLACGGSLVRRRRKRA